MRIIIEGKYLDKSKIVYIWLCISTQNYWYFRARIIIYCKFYNNFTCRNKIYDKIITKSFGKEIVTLLKDLSNFYELILFKVKLW